MFVYAFLAAWVPIMIYVVVGNYLYFTKILPGLARAGLDCLPKFRPSGQIKQVDAYVALLAAEARRPWYFGLLAHARAITAVILLLMLVALACFAFEGA